MIVIKLLVRYSPEIAVSGCTSFGQNTGSRSIDSRSKPHSLEVLDCLLHHPFKSKLKTNIYG